MDTDLMSYFAGMGISPMLCGIAAITHCDYGAAI